MQKNQPTPPTVVQKAYTVQEVAQMLNVSLRKAYYICNEAPAFRVFRLGNSIRVHKASFDTWLEGC
jgi:excisionase family DNA binding protein